MAHIRYRFRKIWNRFLEKFKSFQFVHKNVLNMSWIFWDNREVFFKKWTPSLNSCTVTLCKKSVKSKVISRNRWTERQLNSYDKGFSKDKGPNHWKLMLTVVLMNWKRERVQSTINKIINNSSFSRLHSFCILWKQIYFIDFSYLNMSYSF